MSVLGNMPKNPSDKLNSLVKILGQLDSGKRITASLLANSLGVTDRTIYRYMMTLQNAGYPIFFDREKMSYCFMDGFALNQKRCMMSCRDCLMQAIHP